MGITRRGVLAGLLGAAGSSVVARSSLAQNQKFKFKLATSWSPKMPILQDSAELFSDMVEAATNGQVKIKVFAGGELIPPLGVFDAVSSGSIEMGISASYYWAGKINAAPFFSALPYGMNAQQFNAWIIGGEGQELWEELYRNYHLVPMSIGNSGTQMAGWFKKELRSVADLKGLKMRIPGLGGEVMARAGVNVVLMPGGELYTALERGTIDATEWISPFHDERLGLYRAAKYYYYPGWHEPSANLELIVHDKAWDKLPKNLQHIVRACAGAVNNWVLSKSEAENGPALQRMISQHKVQVRPLPDDILKALRQFSEEAVQDLAAKDPFSKKAFASYSAFMKSIGKWSQISEEAYSRASHL